MRLGEEQEIIHVAKQPQLRAPQEEVEQVEKEETVKA